MFARVNVYICILRVNSAVSVLMHLLLWCPGPLAFSAGARLGAALERERTSFDVYYLGYQDERSS